MGECVFSVSLRLETVARVSTRLTFLLSPQDGRRRLTCTVVQPLVTSSKAAGTGLYYCCYGCIQKGFSTGAVGYAHSADGVAVQLRFEVQVRYSRDEQSTTSALTHATPQP
jgi:hypothetical protein